MASSLISYGYALGELLLYAASRDANSLLAVSVQDGVLEADLCRANPYTTFTDSDKVVFQSPPIPNISIHI